MSDAAQVPAEIEGESYEVDTPAGRAVVTFPFDDELPPAYAGEPAAVIALREAIGATVGPMGVALAPDTLTPLALVEILPAENAGFEVGEPIDSSEPAPAMQNQPSPKLDSVAAAPSVADLRSQLIAAGRGVIERLSLARALLSRFTGSNPDAGNDGDTDGGLAPRRATGHFYDFDDSRKPAQRKRENRAAEDLLQKIDTGEVDPAQLTDEQRGTLAKYSGLGGALVGADGRKGSAYEYYTPKPIAEGVWGLLEELGFKGGKVLDPSAGTGIFGATAPLSAAVDAVELSRVSGRINGLVNGGPGYTATIAPYERVAAATPDETYDAVVTNVPFGGVADRGGNNLLDPRYQNEPLQNYFILRTLEKLRPGGLAVFIVPPRCVSGKGGKEEDLRIRTSYMAEFLGAYRLPNEVFGTAAADTITDVIAFRKFSREVREKIDELRQQSPGTLAEANVLWQPFISGRYFLEDGKRFLLGETVVAKGQWGDVEKVTTTKPVGEVAKMLRRFPDSRINWELLDAAPTDPIEYRNGDTITQAGQTLEYRDGHWHPLARNARQGASAEAKAVHFTSPYAAFEAGMTYADANEYLTYMVATSQSFDIPDWVRNALKQVDALGSADRERYWRAGVVGMSVQQVLKERLSEEVGVNYLEEYPALSDAMRTFARVAKNRPGGFAGQMRDGLGAITAHVRKDGYSDVWTGNVQAEVARIDAGEKFTYEGLIYQRRTKWVPMEDAAGVFGPEFDPISSEDWCVSADGKSVCRADDYYIGNVRELMDQLDRDIENAATSVIKSKLLWQKSNAHSRVERVDVRSLNYSWGSPFVELSEKLDFARRFIHESAYIDTDNDGDQSIKLDLPSAMKDSDRGRLLMRVSDYLSRGTVSLATAKFQMQPGQAMAELRRQVATINQQFNGWVRSNYRIMERMESAASDEGRLRFRQQDDESPLLIPGFKQSLHPFQRAFVRKQGREFGGINGFNVGLGKTFTALASAQYAQAMGVKSKTAFVVPNSVLSNWRKEVGRAYEDTSDCLFVGLRVKDGRAIVDSKFYDEDLQLVLTNRHRKVFMTMEAFERLRMRDDTVDAFQLYMGEVDKNFSESSDNKVEEIRKSKVALAFSAIRDKIGAAPYIEDMGFDSLVIDEGHGYKNSVNTVEFKGAKFLSLPDPAKRGIDMQAKAWYIRGASPLRDGVLPLTATPITNSPLEIYSMLALAAGHDRVNDMCLGVKGADDFMEVMTQRENIDDVTIDGEERQTDVFVGLNNLNVLRSALTAVATIKNAEDVGAQIRVPEAQEKADPVSLPAETFDRLRLYKDAFRFAIQNMSGGNVDTSKQGAFDAVSEHFGESMGTMSNAFNLINKMEMLILDPDLDQRATFYSYAKADATKIAKVVDSFNQKKRVEDRTRMNPFTVEAAVVGTKLIKDAASGDKKEILRVQVFAYMRPEEGRVVIDSLTPAVQAEFEDLCAAADVELDVSVPPKLAAMIENVQREMAHPRGVDDEGNYSPIVKQIIFCDRLGMHNKIKRLLAKRCGIPAGKIAIITGQTNNEPDQILAVQDGFNAHGDANRYQIIIANEKAEVGINLQKGTQAIHHISIGWTPDSLTQRNGRGVRQGNETGSVTVYYYDAEGTFDTYRRGMVNKKAEWIGSVLDTGGGNSVNVTGGLSDKQYEALINSLGDADAMTNIQREIDAAEAAERAERARSNQIINAETIAKSIALVERLGDAKVYAQDRVGALMDMRVEIDRLQDRIEAKGATPSARAKNMARQEDLRASADGLAREIDASIIFTPRYGTQTLTADALVRKARDGYRKRGEPLSVPLGREFYSVSVTWVEGSSLHQDWQSELDMARSMARESAENFARLSSENGAFPKEVGEALAAGNGWVHDGRLFTKGAFVRDLHEPGSLMVFLASGKAEARSADGDSQHVPSGFVLGRGHSPILPGADGYAECVALAAKIEDGMALAGQPGQPFSDVVPAVSQLRKHPSVVSYEIAKYRLPPPMFPFVMTKTDAYNSPIRTRIAGEQKSVVRGLPPSYPPAFTAGADQAVVNAPWGAEQCAEAVVDYAIANGLTVVDGDLGYQKQVVSNRVRRALPLDRFVAGLSGVSFGQLNDAASAMVRAAAPWFAMNGQPMDWLDWSYRNALNEALAAAAAAERAASEAAAPASGGAAPAASAAASARDSNEIVAISGDTRKWKDQIKRYATLHGNGRFKWDGKALVWNVYQSAWDALVANYPEAGRELQLTRPTITRF